MTDAKIGFRAGYATVVAGQTFVVVSLDSPMSSTNYQVLLQQQQPGNYDVYPTISTTDEFIITMFPVVEVDVVFSYFVVDRSEVAAESLAEAISALNPVAWFRKGLGITSVATLVSQWADLSGNARHLKQSTGTNQPALQVDGSILFDGVDNFMRTDAFTLNQPETIYLLMKQPVWMESAYVCDGVAADCVMSIRQTSAPDGLRPQAANGGFTTVVVYGLGVDTYGVVAAVFNGAASLIHVNNGTPGTGDCSTGNGGGLTLGAPGAVANSYSNIQVKECILFAAAHDAETRARVIQYLAWVGGLSI